MDSQIFSGLHPWSRLRADPVSGATEISAWASQAATSGWGRANRQEIRSSISSRRANRDSDRALDRGTEEQITSRRSSRSASRVKAWNNVSTPCQVCSAPA
jgi:hypothetical protein